MLKGKIAFSILLSLVAVLPPAVADTQANSIAVQAPAQTTISPALKQKLDALVDENCRSVHEIGYAIAVVDHGQLVYERCFGEAKKDTPVTPQTIFGLASITKTFTALSLISLVDQGKVNLDDSIIKYLPEAPQSWKNISVRQLASMTAGFPRDLEPEAPWRNGGYERVKAMTLMTTPGSEFHYSNIGYRVLGQLIENVSGKSLNELDRELIFAPARMTSTGIVTEFRESPLLASPFVDRNGELKAINYRAPGINFASGNLFSTIDDMAKYAAFLLDGKVVSPQAFQAIWFSRPPLADGRPDYWAFGWGAKAIVEKAPIRKVSMNGGLPGVASTIALYPDQKIGIVSLSNYRAKGGSEIAQQVGRLFIPEDHVPQEGGTPELEEQTKEEGQSMESKTP